MVVDLSLAVVKIKETDLYQPIKELLENQGYEVKSEIGAADIMAVRGDEDLVIIELKTCFSLALFHQAIERQSISDCVYIAVPRLTGRQAFKALQKNLKLCRRLGIGLLRVRLSDGFVETQLDPASYQPRKSSVKRVRLLREFSKRLGDPNKGGKSSGIIITAYRQDALRCLEVLKSKGALKASKVAEITNVSRARNILSADYYGWFERVSRGIYCLTPEGKKAAKDFKNELKNIRKN